MKNRNMGTLLAGLILVGLGVLFLAVNVYQLDIDWIMLIKLLLPILFIWAGAVKLWRHFAWSFEELEKRPGKAGLLSGLFWLSLGTVSALAVFSVLDFLPTAGLYWPVILLLFGLGKIVDFFRMKEIARSSLSEITGVIFIVLIGLGCMKLHQLNLLILEHDPFWNRIPEILGIEELMDPVVEFSTVQDIELGEASGIRIANRFGDITVEGVPAGDGKVTAELLSSMRDKNQERAKALSDRIRLNTGIADGRLLISTNRRELQSAGRKITTSIKLKVPENLRLEADNEFGDIIVTGLRNDCSLKVKKGDITATSIMGMVEVESDSESAELEGIEGDVKVNAKFCEVEIRDVAGNISVITSHKPVKVSGVKGNLKVENRHDDVEAKDISGTVDINNPGGGLSLSGIGGSVKAVNSKGDVNLSGISGPVNLSTAYGSVALADIAAPLEIASRHVDIEGHGFASSVVVRGQTSRVTLKDLENELVIETSQEPVEIVNARGSVSIQNDLGRVKLRLEDPPGSNIRIESRQGDIEVELPGQSSFSINARVTKGKILSDFGTPPAQDAAGDSVFETPIGGGGPELNLLTSGSSIELRRTL